MRFHIRAGRSEIQIRPNEDLQSVVLFVEKSTRLDEKGNVTYAFLVATEEKVSLQHGHLPRNKTQGENERMSIIEQITSEFNELTTDLEAPENQGNTWTLRAGTSENSVISTFPVNVTNDETGDVTKITGAVSAQELKLVEVSLRDQNRKAKPNEPRNKWFRTAEMLFCAPGLMVGVMEDGEFCPLPHYTSDNPIFQAIVNDVPYISAQLMRCNWKITGLGEGHESQGVAEDNLYDFLREQNFKPVDIPSANRLWTLSVEPISNPGDRGFRRNLGPRTNNSQVNCAGISITPSTDPTQGFRDFVNVQLDLIRRVALGNRPNASDAEKLAASQLQTCLTGGSPDERPDRVGRLQPVRVSVGSFVTSVPVPGKMAEHDWNIWPDEMITDEIREVNED